MKDTKSSGTISDTSSTNSVTKENGRGANDSSTNIKNIDVRTPSVMRQASSTTKKCTVGKSIGLKNDFNSTVSPYVTDKKVSTLTDSHIQYDLKPSSYKYSGVYCKEIDKDTNKKEDRTFSVSDEKEEAYYLKGKTKINGHQIFKN